MAADSPDPVTQLGRVLGTEDATPLKFHVAISEGAYAQLDDVIVTVRDVPGVGPVSTAGVVTEVRARHEGASYASDAFLIADSVLPAHVQEVATVETTRVEPELYVPPRPGELCRRATGEERDQALYFDQMDAKVPVGRGRDGSPVYLNLEFLDGTRGAHVSISGVSGVATKTSFALFLLHSLFTSGALGARATNAKALVFSVKGEDLLFLDQANTKLDDETRAIYAALDLPATPFASVRAYAPPRPNDPTGRPNITSRHTGIAPFWWTLHEFCSRQLMPYVFADADDERAQYTMLIHAVSAKLAREAHAAGNDGQILLDGTQCRTWEQLVDLIEDRLTDDNQRDAWGARMMGAGTVNAFLRRLRSSVRTLSPLIRSDLDGQTGHHIDPGNQQVTVIDLHQLPERAQRFVVGVVLATETARKEAAGQGGLLFTMLDELNKYAPREGDSPIKQALLDIAERGRSLGIILIGAQQTASEVERRIVSNSSVKVVGRLDPAEAGRPEYGFLPGSQRQRATLAKPGTMFVSQPEIPVPLAVEFPFPAWATRQSETDPTALVTGGTPPSGRRPDDPFTLAGDDDPAPF